MSENVVVLGASPKPERYSNKAVNMLTENGYNVIPVHPAVKEVNGIKVIASLNDIKENIHTVSLYVNGSMVEQMSNDIAALKPKRVIFNPGTESESALNFFKEKGIDVLEACTLVLLRTHQF
ncbi:MAG: CoA-binding protein [Spirochaetaceae bacterium]|jgi:predicted CoA-binding protein|nr:CoA-binding protein [Spirochaetaceae bacterium]